VVFAADLTDGVVLLRVCYVSSQAVSADGWGRYTVEVASGARARGVEPVLVTTRAEVDPSLAEAEHHPILPPLFAGRLTTLRSLLKALALRRILATCDFVHCIVEPFAPLVALARPRRIPFVLSVFGTWAIRPLERAASRAVFGPAFRSADMILSISGFTRDWMARLIDLPRVEVLPGGVHPERFADLVEADLPEWVGREPLALSVGAVKPRKGQNVALEAVALARQRIPSLHFAMAGNLHGAPAFVERLNHRARELGIEGYVHFLGQLPPYGALTAWYQRADVFILPSVNQGSSFEGLGFVFLEAAAVGTPSIGTRDCGAMEAIIDGETGLLVPQNDPHATADALVRILSDPALSERMGHAAREQARRLSWSNLATRVVAIYTELAEAQGRKIQATEHTEVTED
jgi:glycosyltransferase involved in cell wall biosynthesis